MPQGATAPTPFEPVWEKTYETTLNDVPAFAFDINSNSPAPALADIDADGDLDLFVGAFDRVTYYRNVGTAESPLWIVESEDFLDSVGEGITAYASPAFADIDGDGDLDAYLGSIDEGIWFYRNTGSPTQAQWTRDVDFFGFTTIPPGKSHAPAFGDLDADGDLDALVGSEGGNIYFFRNNGTPTAPVLDRDTSLASLESIEGDTTFADPHLIDMDDDGDLDLLFASGHLFPIGQGAVWYYRNDGTPAEPVFVEESSAYFGIGEVAIYGAFLSQKTGVTAGDLDNDGDPDLIWASDHGYFTYLNQGLPTVPDLVLTDRLFHSFKRLSHSYPNFADVDADGDLDFFIGGVSKLIFLRNIGSPGSPNWSLETEHFLGLGDLQNFEHVVASLADVNDDGYPDLFVSITPLPSFVCRISFYLNQGPPNFDFVLQTTGLQDDTATLIQHGGYMKLELEDLDSDGDVDMLIGHREKGPGGAAGVVYYDNAGDASNPSWHLISTDLLGGQYVPGSFGDHRTLFPELHDIDRDGDLDLFVAVSNDFNLATGRVNYFRNDSTSTTLIWTLIEENYNAMTAHYDDNLVFADTDGDGLAEMYLGGVNGGIQSWRDISSQLSIGVDAPGSIRQFGIVGGTAQEGLLSQTILTGASLQFTTGNEIGSLTWSFVRNESGAAIDPMTGFYTAGPAPGTIDIVRGIDDRNTPSYAQDDLAARAFINVVSPAAVDAAGHVLIVAGSGGAQDISASIDSISATAFGAFRKMGYSPSNITLLSNGVAFDVDGDGQNDVDASAELSNVHNAILSLPASSPRLFVYVIGAGGRQGALNHVRLTSTEILGAALLDQWLDDLQASQAIEVVVCVDASLAAGFLDEMAPPAGQSRVLLASTGAGELAHFAMGGLFSFSGYLLSALQDGQNLRSAFELARGAMSIVQLAALDDDGDGIYDPLLDGATATAITLGASIVSGIQRPQIGRVVPNLRIDGPDPTALVWADEVSAVTDLDLVSALRISPDFDRNLGNLAEASVASLPETELVFDGSTQRYEALFTDLSAGGDHVFVILARDSNENISLPRIIHVYQAQPIAGVASWSLYD